MKLLSRQYADWKAPDQDRELLIWPAPAELLKQTRDNQRRLFHSHAIKVQNIPLSQVRRQMRQFIGQNDSQPLIVSGHQTELYHPGVWVKHVLANIVAEKLSGQAYYLAVDSDAPKHLQLRWPGGSIAITDDPGVQKAAWSGLLAPPTPSHVAHIEQQIAEAHFQFEPMLGSLLLSLRRLALETLNLPAALTNAMHELDWHLGLRHHALLASPIWSNAPFLVFAHHLIAHAGEVAASYNGALAVYRKAHGITSTMRPMPDLFATDESIELPFWLDDLHNGERFRPSAFRQDNGWAIRLVDGEQFDFDPAADGWDVAAHLERWLMTSRHRIAPRALTLTMFVRLFLADQFIHGIGGGRYDQVADQFIADFFGFDPPAFSVTTATMHFPGGLGQERVCVPCVRQEGHRLKHRLLGEKKREFVTAIEAAPRHSADRSRLFYEMQSQLATASAESEPLRRWRERLNDTVERGKEQDAMLDRELFYAMQSRERLEQMIGNYRMATAK